MRKVVLLLYFLTPVIYFTENQLKNIYAISLEPTSYKVDRYLGRVYCTFWVVQKGEATPIKVRTLKSECKEFMEIVKQ